MSTQVRQIQGKKDIIDSSSEDEAEDLVEAKQDKPKPGKLDLSQFDNITNAIGKLNVQPPIKASPIDANPAYIRPDFNQSPITQRLFKHSKDYKVSELNSPYESENEHTPPVNSLRGQKLYRGQSLGSENSFPTSSIFVNSSIDSSELISSRDAAIRQLNEILANKQPPGRFGGHKHLTGRSASLLHGHQEHDQQHQQHQEQQSSSSQSGKKNSESKKDKKKIRDDEKMEKRRLKEEERLRRQEKKHAAKKSKAGLTEPNGPLCDDGVPFFIKRCIEFIEYEGLDAEGIYRVPGNRAHVDAFIQKFKENPEMSIVESDIPVNAVATALKDFLSKKCGPIIPIALMNELTELSNISSREHRIQAVKQLIKKLPHTSYKLLQYLFSHFVKVSLNHSLNSMDSKNLAICWWPTLLPLHFSDMVMFEQMRPHLEESIQTMIDHYDFIFDDNEPSSIHSLHRPTDLEIRVTFEKLNQNLRDNQRNLLSK